MARGSVFITNKGHTVRLPKSVRLPEGVTTVDIVRRGRSWVITPTGETWAQWFESEAASQDFTGDREQPTEQDRASF